VRVVRSAGELTRRSFRGLIVVGLFASLRAATLAHQQAATARGGHPAAGGPFTLTDGEVLAIVILPILALVIVSALVRLRRANAAVRAALERDGYRVLRMHRRILRQGPLFWTTTRSQIVYRVLVRDAAGRQRELWARWGRTWLPKPDRLELRWDE